MSCSVRLVRYRCRRLLLTERNALAMGGVTERKVVTAAIRTSERRSGQLRKEWEYLSCLPGGSGSIECWERQTIDLSRHCNVAAVAAITGAIMSHTEGYCIAMTGHSCKTGSACRNEKSWHVDQSLRKVEMLITTRHFEGTCDLL